VYRGALELEMYDIAAIRAPGVQFFWLGVVKQISGQEITVRWFHKILNRQWVYQMRDEEDEISMETVICSGIELYPSISNKTQIVEWKLLTPPAFIKSLDRGGSPSNSLGSKWQPTIGFKAKSRTRNMITKDNIIPMYHQILENASKFDVK
jgi:hypothetical protein